MSWGISLTNSGNPHEPTEAALNAFIDYWSGREGGQERANYQLFLIRFCELLDVHVPDAAEATRERNDYVFERAVDFKDADGTESTGRIDLYKRGSFVLEAKQSRMKGGKKEVPGQADLFGGSAQASPIRGRRSATGRGWDVLMLNARRQAESYAKALPPSHGWPPFILVCDVGRCIEVYADFSGQGKNYAQFPDRQGFRISLDDLRQPEIRERLRKIWEEPQSLDPARISADVTRGVAERLAAVSRALEKDKHPPEAVAMFLMRCLFTMFAEDVELLPKNSFRDLLARCETDPSKFERMVGQLWEAMDQGNFAYAIEAQVKRFNGEFFRDRRALPLAKEEIGELRQAASANWRNVEPAIFGTLLEQALDPVERQRLGAHYTPRAYVERLVIATLIEPLRSDWSEVLATAERQKAEGRAEDAVTSVREFHAKLCAMRILDPACGTGNFLYVSLELLKRLEGEVIEALLDLGEQEALHGLEGHTVDPHQFLGIEVNPRASAITELVLWIGYLQWHFHTQEGAPAEPILKAFHNIETRNAVLVQDRQLARGPDGKLRAGADGKSEVYAYPDPKRPEWPVAEFIVGNPPFIGGKDLRDRLGDAEAEALWAAHPQMNEGADLVMYWWDHAAEILALKSSVLRRFGLVTTNSISQVFQRRVIERHLKGRDPMSIVMAIPDHPWTKATPDSAAVRIAMTVGEAGRRLGILREVTSEENLDTDQPRIDFNETVGAINSDLTVGIDVSTASPLRANDGLCSRGMSLHGSGFIVKPSEAELLGLGRRSGLNRHIRPYRNGRDLTDHPRGVLVIDLFGLDSDQVRKRFPEVYQHVLTTVKPERDKNNRESYRDNWWIFGEPRRELRPALNGLRRYIVTVETAKHRAFLFVDGTILPDNRLVCFAMSDGYSLGALSSRIHVIWTLATGGTLEDRPIYTKSRCFDPFPFPDATEAQKRRIGIIAEEIDAHRKARQAEHPDLTLTAIYNVLEMLRAGIAPDELDDDSRHVFDKGLVLILRELHDRLDVAVADAYGWPADLSEDEILAHLVALNQERATEENRGQVRWLRPEYQIERFGTPTQKEEQYEAELVDKVAKVQKRAFPTNDVEQTAAVMSVLADALVPMGAADVAATFKPGRKVQAKVDAVMMALARMAYIAPVNGSNRYTLRHVS